MAQAINNGESGESVRQKLNDFAGEFNTHESNVSNPHQVTKSQLGLGSVDNTSDASKPISSATAAALVLKADVGAAPETGLTVQFLRDGVYGSIDDPINTDITCDVVAAKLMVTNLILHQKATEPAYPANFVLISGTYDPAKVNRILCTYIDDDTIDYSISQPQ